MAATASAKVVIMATVTQSMKESLIGKTEPPQLSREVRANFLKYAKPDENGELYMGLEEFIRAIAPAEEDYVSGASVLLGDRSLKAGPRCEPILLRTTDMSTFTSTR